MKKKVLLPLALMVVFALSRCPGVMPQNFSAAYAIAFCAGLYLPAALGWVAPLGLLALTDLALNRLYYPGWEFSWVQFLGTEAGFVALIALGRLVGSRRPLWMLVGGGLLGAAVFYLITNTASWLYLPYPKTLGGLIQALTVGFPQYPQTWEFFRNTLLSGGLFTGLFAGAMKLSESAESAEEKEAAPEAKPDNEGAEA